MNIFVVTQYFPKNVSLRKKYAHTVFFTVHQVYRGIRIGIGQNGAYRRLARVRNRTVGGAGGTSARHPGLHFNAFLILAHAHAGAFCTSWISRGEREGEGGCRRGAADWLTCRFIDEFGRTFVHRGFQYN